MSNSGLATLRDYIRWAISQFSRERLFFHDSQAGIFEEARALVLGSVHLPDAMHDKYLDCNLHQDEHAIVQDILSKRIEQRIPAAYLLGQVWFAGLLFKIDKRVKVPNSPLEELIPQRFAPWLIKTPQRILNLYCGSGCLGIVCAEEFAEAEVVLADASNSALQVAAENITLHQLDERIKTQRSDLFLQLAGQRFDLIVCQPPSLSVEQWTQLPREFHYEPQDSSIAKSGGLERIQAVLQNAAAHLSDNGLLVLDIGQHRERLTALYPDLDFTWLEHSHAGVDVLALTAQQCAAYRALSKDSV
ncbi:MAG TPA: 50S ribosomal protein L3 N(5)-glutamine methyltransferase [Thiopseudomonas sp.]|nr:50S ribosomal protein L3 N(5)-glutamine methyltransferase [Thiopseudomonas sp.]